MVNQVEWSIKAQDTFDSIISYLEKEWTEKEVKNFVTRVYEKLELLRQFPEIGVPNIKKKNSYRTLIHKKVTLVYHYKPIKKKLYSLHFGTTCKTQKVLSIRT
jgi:plasmid stabilization system protein ParE